MKSSVEGVVVKLGGSIVTDKGSDELRVNEALVARLGRELAVSEVRPLVIVHGAGSYGHRIVKRTGIHHGLDGPETLLAMGETQQLQYELDAIIARILLAQGLPVMPVQASASALMRNGKLERMALDATRLMLGQGMVPLFYGVPAADSTLGCSILSGDQIAPYVAYHLGIRRVIHATDVDGVFDADPADQPEAAPIPVIQRTNWEQVRGRLSGSSHVDVTGGMAGKVGALMDWAREGLATRIIDARQEGRLTAALSGETVGTLVCWEAP